MSRRQRELLPDPLRCNPIGVEDTPAYLFPELFQSPSRPVSPRKCQPQAGSKTFTTVPALETSQGRRPLRMSKLPGSRSFCDRRLNVMRDAEKVMGANGKSVVSESTRHQQSSLAQVPKVSQATPTRSIPDLPNRTDPAARQLKISGPVAGSFSHMGHLGSFVADSGADSQGFSDSTGRKRAFHPSSSFSSTRPYLDEAGSFRGLQSGLDSALPIKLKTFDDVDFVSNSLTVYSQVQELLNKLETIKQGLDTERHQVVDTSKADFQAMVKVMLRQTKPASLPRPSEPSSEIAALRSKLYEVEAQIVQLRHVKAWLEQQIGRDYHLEVQLGNLNGQSTRKQMQDVDFRRAIRSVELFLVGVEKPKE